MNTLKTALFLGLLTGLLVAIGGLVGGRTGMIVALVLAGAMNFFSYWYSDKIVLRAYRAQVLERHEAPALYDMVDGLRQNAGLPMPRVALIPDPTPNAFATGRDPAHAVVAVTQGIVDLLSPRELRGVLAHELGHVQDRDILVSSVAATVAGAVMVLADMARWAMIFGGGRGDEEGEGGGGIVGLLVMSILAPLAAMLIQMAISRGREYLADSEGAQICGDPEALASALAKLQNANQRQPMESARPQTAHMFIVNPLAGRSMASLFSTHPPMEERIARLRAMAPGRPAAPPQRPVSFSPPPPPPPPGPAADGGRRGKIDWS